MNAGTRVGQWEPDGLRVGKKQDMFGLKGFKERTSILRPERTSFILFF